MPSVKITLNAEDLARLNRRIADLIHDADHLEPVMEQASEYMQRATINRILRSKRGPDGEYWQALSDVTVELKGHDRPLFQTGELSRSIEVTDVSNHGFELTAESDHAAYMQFGVERSRGWIKNAKIPARPFMGFSEENNRRIGKMIRDYLAHGSD